MNGMKKARRCGNTDGHVMHEHHEDSSYYPRANTSCQGGAW